MFHSSGPIHLYAQVLLVSKSGVNNDFRGVTASRLLELWNSTSIKLSI